MKMREIKFKAVYEGKVYEVTNIIFPGEHTGAVEIKVVGNKPGDYVCKWVPFKKCTLIQYTGLKDKNDKEIYEGDITRDKWGNLDVIKWHKEYGAFYTCPVEHFHDEDLPGEYLFSDLIFRNNVPEEYLEVIGNAYQNTELLEVKEV
jgi:uncharacterized phage protein (TIGR01671 family)